MENKHEIVAVVDIGTTKIVVLLGHKILGGKFEIVGFGTTPSVGIQRGVVSNIDDTVRAIKTAVEEAHGMSDINYKDVFVGIAGQHVLSNLRSCSIKNTDEDRVIKKHHIDGLIDMINNAYLDDTERVVDIIPRSYVVDGKIISENPIGKISDELKGNFQIVTAQTAMINNILKCVATSGLNLKSLMLEPIASAEAVLTTLEKEKGVVMIDIGGGTTDIAIYKDSKLIYTAVVPLGGNTITGDIRQVLGINQDQAEQLKKQYGSAIVEEENNALLVLDRFNGRSDINVEISKLSEIINNRMLEMLHAVTFQVESVGGYSEFGAGLVITGGGSLMKNISQLAAYVTKADVRIGFPTSRVEGKMTGILNKPQYSTAVGLLMKGDLYRIEELQREEEEKNKIQQEVKDQEEQTQPEKTQQKEPILGKFFSTISRIFEEDDDNNKIQ